MGNFRCDKLEFIVLLHWRGSALPSPGEKVAHSAGCGKRETQLDAEKCKDLLKTHPIGGLMPLSARQITARIPHPSSKLPWARGNFESTFPPGEGTRLRR